MSPPRFSIVTVTLDPGDDLVRTVASVDAQRGIDYEHLVKDAGSRDGSVERMPASEVRRVVRAPDQGIYDAMNQALVSCKGEYLLFLNAGDELIGSDALLRVSEHLGESQPDLAYSDIEDLDRRATINYPDRVSPFFFYRTGLCHQACFIRADLYGRLGGFDSAFRIAADHEFLTRAIVRERAVARHLPLVVVRYQGGGFSASPARRHALAGEVRELRRRNFTLGQRCAYRVLWEATLPHLRKLVNTAGPLRPLRPIYARLVSAIYRAGNSGRPEARR